MSYLNLETREQTTGTPVEATPVKADPVAASHLDRLLVKPPSRWEVFVQNLKDAFEAPPPPPAGIRPVQQVGGPDADNLAHLLPPQQSWLQGFVQNLKDTFNPPKLPPLELTSKPVYTKSMWGLYKGNESASGALSLAVHILLIFAALFITIRPSQPEKPKEDLTLLSSDIAPYVAKPAKQMAGGGGGGGDRSPLPADRGKLPKIAQKQFTPPVRVPNNDDPKLPMEPTIVAPPDVPNIAAQNIGDPLSKFGVPSNGTGFGGGIGSGGYGGIGSGTGPGVGPGRGGGFGGGVYRIGGGVSAPAVVFKVEPEYSEEARKAKWQGTVLLSIVVDEKGNPRDIKVLRSLGLGLDQKAIEAVEKWRFKPGMKDGRPVAVSANVEVNFRLL